MCLYVVYNFVRCRMNSSSKAAWISDSYQFSSSMHPRSDRSLIKYKQSFFFFFFFFFFCFFSFFFFFSLFIVLCLPFIYAEARPMLAPEHTCLPLAAGHWGFTAAAPEGGAICSPSCADGAHPHHQARDPQLCSHTVKPQLFCACAFVFWRL